MRTFGYVRVSAIEQEGGHGPEVQAAAIRAYCLAKALGEPEIVHESASGESITGRKEFVALLAQARELVDAGEQVAIVFRSSDRLARDLMDQESVVATSFATGFRLHSTQPHEADLFDPKFARDPMRAAIRQFFGIFNQLDRAIIQQRLDGGLFMKASQGGSTGGRYPFGYHGVNGEITPCPEEVPAVQRCFECASAGLDLGSTAAILAREFADVCGGWTKTQVKRVLDRRALYVDGMYRSRLAVAETHRPDLAIVKLPEGATALASRAPVDAAIDWTTVPDPVAAHALALLIGQPVPWLQAQATALGLVVRWRKTRMLFPHASARALERAARGSVRAGA